MLWRSRALSRLAEQLDTCACRLLRCYSDHVTGCLLSSHLPAAAASPSPPSAHIPWSRCHTSAQSAAELDQPLASSSSEPEPADRLLPAESPVAGNATATRRVPRRHHALYFGYLGANYYGNQMQFHRDAKPTVERTLIGALFECGAIDALPQQYMPDGFSRMSRTDRGVSAAGNCCCVYMRAFPGVVEALNAALPDDVRVFACQRVVPSLEVRRHCNSRHYSYTMPSFALAAFDRRVDYSFRVNGDELARAAAVLRRFVGRHSFHNFSPSGSCEDVRMLRVVLSVRLEPPTLVDGVEFVTVHLHGYSFVLSQIRRMLGVTIAACRACTDGAMLDRALSHASVSTTTAPGLGLVLERGEFLAENYRWREHGRLDHSRISDQMQQFRRDVILQHIHRREVAEHSMLNYLHSLHQVTIGSAIGRKRLSSLGLAAQRAALEAGDDTGASTALRLAPN